MVLQKFTALTHHRRKIGKLLCSENWKILANFDNTKRTTKGIQCVNHTQLEIHLAGLRKISSRLLCHGVKLKSYLRDRLKISLLHVNMFKQTIYFILQANIIILL